MLLIWSAGEMYTENVRQARSIVCVLYGRYGLKSHNDVYICRLCENGMGSQLID